MNRIIIVVAALLLSVMVVCVPAAIAGEGKDRAGWKSVDLSSFHINALIDVPANAEVTELDSLFAKDVSIRLSGPSGRYEFTLLNDSGINDPEYINYKDARAARDLGEIVKSENDASGWLVVYERKLPGGSKCRTMRSRRSNIPGMILGVGCVSECVPPDVAKAMEQACLSLRAAPIRK
jgi:hypothetical protein